MITTSIDKALQFNTQMVAAHKMKVSRSELIYKWSAFIGPGWAGRSYLSKERSRNDADAADAVASSQGQATD